MIPASLRALLSEVIDYAGLYPPAALPLPQVIENYRRYLQSPERWMLNRLVLPMEKLSQIALAEDWRITLLVDAEPGPLPPQIETLETTSAGRLSLPTYCEAPLEAIEDAYAKIRTADLSSQDLATFVAPAAARRLPFKATAGLHHPIRSAAMHGFINVFAAAVFAMSAMDRPTLIQLLDDTDPRSFHFTEDALHWRDWHVSTPEIAAARRNFAHSFGSCSFEEPIDSLRSLGLLP